MLVTYLPCPTISTELYTTLPQLNPDKYTRVFTSSLFGTMDREQQDTKGYC